MSNTDDLRPARLARLARVSAESSPGNIRARVTAAMLDSMSPNERAFWAQGIAYIAQCEAEDNKTEAYPNDRRSK